MVYEIQTTAGSLPTISVEGFIKGEVVGGIELLFPLEPGTGYLTYFPIIMR
jgi:hypothetical protein